MGLVMDTDGATTLFPIEPDPSGLKPLATAEMLTAAETGNVPRAARFGTRNWAPIALADEGCGSGIRAAWCVSGLRIDKARKKSFFEMSAIPLRSTPGGRVLMFC